MQVPKLRFKSFTDEWKSYKLKDFSDRVVRKNKNNISRLPLTISAQDGLVDQTTFFNKTVASKDLTGYYLLYNGDFAYNKSYSNGYPWGTIKRLDKYDMGVLSTLYICFKPKNDINSNFLVQLFNSSVWYNGISEIAVEGARNHGLLNISVNDFFETKYKVPSIEEQTKIADFLSLIDKKIELQTQLVDNLNLYKKGLLQKVFSNNSGWKTVKFDDIFKIVSTKKYQINSKEYLSFGKYPVIDQGKKKIIGYSNNESKVLKCRKSGLIIFGDHTRELKFIDFDFIVGADGVQLIYSSTVNTKYLYYYLQTCNIQNDGYSRHFKYLKELNYFIPSTKEQNRIADLFTSIDDKISYETKKLENLKTYKKGLLQKMFI